MSVRGRLESSIESVIGYSNADRKLAGEIADSVLASFDVTPKLIADPPHWKGKPFGGKLWP